MRKRAALSRGSRAFVLAIMVTFAIVGGLHGTASAKPRQCPSSSQLAGLPELEAFVLQAGGEIGPELTSFFELTDANHDGLICFKTLPEATPFPTPPLLAGDNKLPK